jgi:hypothetical protein
MIYVKKYLNNVCFKWFILYFSEINILETNVLLNRILFRLHHQWPMEIGDVLPVAFNHNVILVAEISCDPHSVSMASVGEAINNHIPTLTHESSRCGSQLISKVN